VLPGREGSCSLAAEDRDALGVVRGHEVLQTVAVHVALRDPCGAELRRKEFAAALEPKDAA
jgi:hypothetical protein